MRHTAHVKLKKVKLTYTLTSALESIPSKPQIPRIEVDVPCKALNDDDCVLYALRVSQLQAKVQSFLKRTKQNPTKQTMINEINGTVDVLNYDQMYHDAVRSIFERVISSNSTHKNSNEVFRVYVDEMYKEFFFYHNYMKCFEMPQTIRCIYPTLTMFEHSCDPNCFLM